MFHELKGADPVPLKTIGVFPAAPVIPPLELSRHDVSVVVGSAVAVSNRLPQSPVVCMCGGKPFA